ncbi:hypothetical protein B0H11DRAFT_1918713 [Mycena galericulata]|nr:hypothetical protein B0H11DRAFT_1918713 [Mycena galericulata]
MTPILYCQLRLVLILIQAGLEGTYTTPGEVEAARTPPGKLKTSTSIVGSNVESSRIEKSIRGQRIFRLGVGKLHRNVLGVKELSDSDWAGHTGTSKIWLEPYFQRKSKKTRRKMAAVAFEAFSTFKCYACGGSLALAFASHARGEFSLLELERIPVCSNIWISRVMFMSTLWTV